MMVSFMRPNYSSRTRLRNRLETPQAFSDLCFQICAATGREGDVNCARRCAASWKNADTWRTALVDWASAPWHRIRSIAYALTADASGSGLGLQWGRSAWI